jgi:hypothetical protein
MIGVRVRVRKPFTAEDAEGHGSVGARGHGRTGAWERGGVGAWAHGRVGARDRLVLLLLLVLET